MSDTTIYASSIVAESGEYSVKIDIDTLYELILAEHAERDKDEQLFIEEHTKKRQNKTLGPPRYIDVDKLAQTHWGIILPPEPLSKAEQEHLNALQDLISHRRQQMGGKHHQFYYQKNWTYYDFLWEVGPWVETGQMQPDRVPYYLCIVGSPERIPWQFQQRLAGEYAVGRLWFDEPEDCKRYVKHLLTYEQMSSPIPTARKALFVGPQHKNDSATQSSATFLVKPLYDWLIGNAKLGFSAELLLGNQAYKTNFLQKLKAQNSTEKPMVPPTFLFTAGHGLEYAQPCDTQYEKQGALLFQEWPGPRRPASPTHYFSGDQVSSELCLLGTTAFSFACFSAGTPLKEDWVKPNWWQKLFGRPRNIAKKPFVARLPQKLLAHGMVSFIGHVSRAWTYSFRGVNLTSTQIITFQDTIYQLLRGKRVGHATDYLNERWVKLTAQLDKRVNDKRKYTKKQIAATWLARNDMRGYVVLGDPAARIRVEALP